MNDRRRVSANILWLLAEKLIRIGLNFAIVGVLARHLGPADFGALNYAVALAGLFTAVATLGLDTIVVRELVRTPDAAETILGTAFALRLLGAVAAILLLAVNAPWLVSDQASLRPLVTIASLGLAWQAFDVVDLWFQKNLQSRHTVAAKLAAFVLGAGVKLWLVAQAAPVAWFCWAVVFEGTCYAAALLWVYHRQGGRIARWRFSSALAAMLLQSAWPLITSSLLVAAYLRLDQFLVLRWLGADQLGLYTAATKVADLWILVSAFVLTSVFPVLAARHEGAAGSFQRDLQFAFDAMTGLGYVIAVSVSLGAPLLVPLIFGDSYQPAARVVAVLAWSAPFVFSGGVRAHYFILERATIYHNWAALAGIAANVGLAFWLMPRLGAAGAALAVVLSAALSVWLTSFLFPRARPCGRLQTNALLLPFRPHAWAELVRRLR